MNVPNVMLLLHSGFTIDKPVPSYVNFTFGLTMLIYIVDSPDHGQL